MHLVRVPEGEETKVTNYFTDAEIHIVFHILFSLKSGCVLQLMASYFYWSCAALNKLSLPVHI